MPKNHNTRRYRSGLEREAAAFLKVNQKKNVGRWQLQPTSTQRIKRKAK